MSITNQLRREIRRYSESQIQEIKGIVDIEYDRRIKAELNNKKVAS